MFLLQADVEESNIMVFFSLPLLRLLKNKTTPSSGGKDKVGFVLVFLKEGDLLRLLSPDNCVFTDVDPRKDEEENADDAQ